ncbi:M24 family metallopeptidase, partial [Candidatus Saccharibacteria bacterium]|nr:M24 family metallopeptidase [Candidatus Saccharibacteria bacterium]
FSMLRPGVLLKEYQEELEVYAKKVFLPLGVKINRYPHGFSHFLGLDVHDAGDYGAPLPEGSVITVEPGIYLPDEGIGIRMEDNVLITKNGIKNLSSHIPKTL